jgi:hypothetical protein
VDLDLCAGIRKDKILRRKTEKVEGDYDDVTDWEKDDDKEKCESQRGELGNEKRTEIQ